MGGGGGGLSGGEQNNKENRGKEEPAAWSTLRIEQKTNRQYLGRKGTEEHQPRVRGRIDSSPRGYSVGGEGFLMGKN